MKNIIELKNINFMNIIKNFNMAIPENSFIFLSGPNNSGKTLLLKLIDRKYDFNGNIFYNQKDISEYNIDEYYRNIKVIIPKEIIFTMNTVEEEINKIDNSDVDKKSLLKELKLTRYKKSLISNLDIKNLIKLQILINLLQKPQVLLIDDLSYYFTKEELKEIIMLLKYFQQKYKNTIVLVSLLLDNSIFSDELIIIENSQVILQGKPMEILKKDNILNKIGLNIPFMIDLSVKLIDYDLIDEIILDKEEMVNKLWK